MPAIFLELISPGKGKLTMSEIKKRLQTFYKDFKCDVTEPKFYCFSWTPRLQTWDASKMQSFGMSLA